MRSSPSAPASRAKLPCSPTCALSVLQAHSRLTQMAPAALLLAPLEPPVPVVLPWSLWRTTGTPLLTQTTWWPAPTQMPAKATAASCTIAKRLLTLLRQALSYRRYHQMCSFVHACHIEGAASVCMRIINSIAACCAALPLATGGLRNCFSELSGCIV